MYEYEIVTDTDAAGEIIFVPEIYKNGILSAILQDFCTMAAAENSAQSLCNSLNENIR